MREIDVTTACDALSLEVTYVLFTRKYVFHRFGGCRKQTAHFFWHIDSKYVNNVPAS